MGNTPRQIKPLTVIDVADIYALSCDVTVKFEKFTHAPRLSSTFVNEWANILKIDLYYQKIDLYYHK